MKRYFLVFAVLILLISGKMMKEKFGERVQLEPFKIVGIYTETTNQDGQTEKALGELWGRFFSENVISGIPNSISNEIHVIYTDYESDYRGKYTAIIGLKVNTLENIPEGMMGREFKGGNYTKVLVKGLMPDAIIQTWQKVWEADKELNRKYTADFEVYGPNFQNGAESEIDIYIATK